MFWSIGTGVCPFQFVSDGRQVWIYSVFFCELNWWLCWRNYYCNSHFWILRRILVSYNIYVSYFFQWYSVMKRELEHTVRYHNSYLQFWQFVWVAISSFHSWLIYTEWRGPVIEKQNNKTFPSFYNRPLIQSVYKIWHTRSTKMRLWRHMILANGHSTAVTLASIRGSHCHAKLGSHS